MSNVTLTTIQDAIHNLSERIHFGCGNHGCLIKAPKGMGTNMNCKCTPREISRELLDIAISIEKMGKEWKKL